MVIKVLGAIGILVLLVVTVVLTIESPAVVAMLAAGAALVFIILLRPSWLAPLALVLAFTATPAIIPTQFAVGGITISAFEPVLLLAAVWAITTKTISDKAALRIVLIAMIIAWGAVVGVAAGHGGSLVFTEIRYLIELVLGMLVGVAVVGARLLNTVLRVWKWSLWVSTVFVIAGMTLGLPLNGRTEAAALFVGGVQQASDVDRLLTAATHAALATICAVVGLLVASRISIRSSLPFLAPALIVTFASFSRNSLLAVGAAFVFAALFVSTCSAPSRR